MWAEVRKVVDTNHIDVMEPMLCDANMISLGLAFSMWVEVRKVVDTS